MIHPAVHKTPHNSMVSKPAKQETEGHRPNRRTLTAGPSPAAGLSFIPASKIQQPPHRQGWRAGPRSTWKHIKDGAKTWTTLRLWCTRGEPTELALFCKSALRNPTLPICRTLPPTRTVIPRNSNVQSDAIVAVGLGCAIPVSQQKPWACGADRNLPLVYDTRSRRTISRRYVCV